jgi:hypothetical protein
MRRGTSYLKYRVLVWLVAGVILLGTLASGLAIWFLRADAIDDAVADAHNIATVLSEQTASSVQSIDIVLRDMEERIEASGVMTPDDFQRIVGTEAVYAFLNDRLARLPQANVLALIASDGQVVNFTRSWPPPPTNVADRDHFQYAKANSGKELRVSAPVPNVLTGAPIIYFSRRIQGRNGEFLGVATVGVGPDYFRNIYSAITRLHDQSFMLLRSDGTVFLRYPDINTHPGEKMPTNSPWYDRAASGGGTYRTPGIFDHRERWIAVQPLQDYPLVINVGVSEAAAL